MTLLESSLSDLYSNAVVAFPRTTKRQHSVDPIIIEELRWMPFVGMKTLFIKAEARNEERHYSPIILLKGIDYAKNDVRITANDGKEYDFGKLSLEDCQVLVRCNCPDFHWRFNYYNHQENSLYGRVRSPYESKGGPPANPSELSGMCKHLMKTMAALRDAGIFQD